MTTHTSEGNFYLNIRELTSRMLANPRNTLVNKTLAKQLIGEMKDTMSFPFALAIQTSLHFSFPNPVSLHFQHAPAGSHVSISYLRV